MITIQTIKKFAGKKRMSKKALEKIEKILESEAKELIRIGVRNADFSGRRTIKEEDIEG